MELPRDIVFYDGECGLCHATVRRVWQWDRCKRFAYAPLQGSTARTILGRHGIDPGTLDGLWLVTARGTPEESLAHRSDAVVEIMRRLEGWPRVLALLGWVPRSWREWAYGWIAQRRYAWFGPAPDACPIPSPEGQARLLP